jgi:hypothetical protein
MAAAEQQTLRLPNAISSVLQQVINGAQDANDIQAIFDEFMQDAFPFGPVTSSKFSEKFSETMTAAQNGLPPSSQTVVLSYKEMTNAMTAVVNSSSEARHSGNTVKIVAALTKHVGSLTKEGDKQRTEQAKLHKWTTPQMMDNQDTREFQRRFMKEMAANNVRDDNEILRYLRSSMDSMPNTQKDALTNMIKADVSLEDNWVLIHKHYMAANNRQSALVRQQFRDLAIQVGESLPLFKIRLELLYAKQFLKKGNLGTTEHVAFIHDLIKQSRSQVAHAAANQHHQGNKDDLHGVDGLEWKEFWQLMINTEASVGLPPTSATSVDDRGGGGNRKRAKMGNGLPSTVDADAQAKQGSRVAEDADKPCYAFGSGTCAYGEKCKFSHDPSKKAEKNDCRNFKRGHCAHGDKCRYNHAAPAAAK